MARNYCENSNPSAQDGSLSTEIGPSIKIENIETYEETTLVDAREILNKEDDAELTVKKEQEEIFTVKEEIEELPEDTYDFDEIDEIELEPAEEVMKTEEQDEEY